MTSQRPDPASIPNLPDTLDAFAAAWTTLARLLTAAPTQEQIDAVRGMADQWPLTQDVSATRRGVRLMARSLEDGETEDQVRKDFQLLYLGPGHLEAPPYESVHLNNSGLVFEKETLEVRAFYRRFGLQLERQDKDPDDHVAIELEMLATLAIRALDALDAAAEKGDAGALPDAVRTYVDAIGEFLENHALLWHHRLGELTVEKASTSFVQGLGSLLMGASTQAGDVFAAEVEMPAYTPIEKPRRGKRRFEDLADTSNAADVWAEVDAQTQRELEEALRAAEAARGDAARGDA